MERMKKYLIPLIRNDSNSEGLGYLCKIITLTPRLKTLHDLLINVFL